MKNAIVRSRWSWFDKLVALLLVAMAVAFFASDTLGAYVGRAHPVVEDFTFTPVAGALARAKGTMDIVRPECRQPEVEAFIGSRRAPIEIIFEEGVKARYGGEQEWGPWRFVGLDPDLTDRVTLEVTHSCPWRFWRTRTVLKP